jgi:hypothetical protein
VQRTGSRLKRFIYTLGALGAALGITLSHTGCGKDTIVVLPTSSLPPPNGGNTNTNNNIIGIGGLGGLFGNPTPAPTAAPTATPVVQ